MVNDLSCYSISHQFKMIHLRSVKKKKKNCKYLRDCDCSQIRKCIKKFSLNKPIDIKFDWIHFPLQQYLYHLKRTIAFPFRLSSSRKNRLIESI